MSYKISVIVSTYNWPKALAASLSSLVRQGDDNYEILVADDGSTEETREVVSKFSLISKVPIKHVWQPDEGFQLAKIRNKAVREAEGEYLLFLDGDCIPTPNWIQMCRHLAEPGWVVQGQRILLSEDFSRQMLDCPSKFFSSPTIVEACRLYLEGKINRCLPLLHIPLGLIRKARPKNWKKVCGYGIAIWKKDLMRVRGFDESFVGWGHEDADFAVRLVNAGVQIKYGVFSAPVFHLWHRLASRNSASKNLEIVYERLRNGTVFPTKGIEI